MKGFLTNIIDKLKDSMQKEVTIDYDLTDSYILIYDEAYGVARKRRRLLRNPRTKTYTYVTKTICSLLFIVLINALAFLYLYKFGYSYWICMICIFIPLVYLTLAIDIVIFILRVTIRSKKVKGSFLLSKEGLTDSTFNGIKILFEWDKIKMVVIKKNSIIILTDTPIYFFVNKDIDKQLIREIKRFKKDIIVVRDDK